MASLQRYVGVAFVAVAMAISAACGNDGGGPAKPPVGEAAGGHPATLEGYFQALMTADKAGDRERVLDLTLGAIPTTADLKQVLRPGAETEAFLKAFESKDIGRDDPRAKEMKLVSQDPEQAKRTEVRVHAATTEEIVAYAEGSVAKAEFPGGMRRFAERVAAPGRTWYAVELLEPGKDSGTRYTAFTRLGDRWLIVAKPWRAIPDAK